MTDSATTLENTTITPLLRIMTTIEVIVLAIAGVGLLFFHDFTRTFWAWDITPFNAGFLGAIYLASMIAVSLLLLMPRWSSARLLVPMIFAFTLVVLIASLLHMDRFNFQRIPTWIWFVLYILLPLNCAYHIWLYRKRQHVNAVATPSLIQAWLAAQSIILALYAVAMILAPATFTAFWPWKIDDFHAHMYSALGFSAAVSGLLLFRRGSGDEFFILGITQITLAVLSILGVVIRSARVDYSAFGTWLWLGAFGLAAVTGVAIFIHGVRLRSEAVTADTRLSASL
jgi:hypothetical protein